MKLKKMASLALAGLMAVSMLAGCSNGSNSNDNGDTTPATTSVVDAVNNGQSANNDVKITFTADSELDATVKRAAEAYGVSLTTANLQTTVENLADIKSVPASAKTGSFKDGSGLLNGTTNYYYVVNNQKLDLDGDTYTYVGYKEYSGFLNETAVLKAIAKEANTLIAALPAHSALTNNANDYDGVVNSGDELKSGEKYYAFSYDGNISMTSVQNLNGTTDYYVVYVVNQTVAEKKL